MCPKNVEAVAYQHPPANSHSSSSSCSSSLHQVGRERLLREFESVPLDDLLNGDVRPCEEPDQTNDADDDVLNGHQWWEALRVKSYNLEHWGED